MFFSYIEIQGEPAFGIDPMTGVKSLRVFSDPDEAEVFFRAVNRRDELKTIEDPLELVKQSLRSHILRFEVDPSPFGPKGSLPITHLAYYVAAMTTEAIDAFGGYEMGAPALAPDLAFAVIKLGEEGFLAVKHASFGPVAAVFSCPAAAAAFTTAQGAQETVKIWCLSPQDVAGFVRASRESGLTQFVIDPGVGPAQGPTGYLDDLAP